MTVQSITHDMMVIHSIFSEKWISSTLCLTNGWSGIDDTKIQPTILLPFFSWNSRQYRSTILREGKEQNIPSDREVYFLGSKSPNFIQKKISTYWIWQFILESQSMWLSMSHRDRTDITKAKCLQCFSWLYIFCKLKRGCFDLLSKKY